MAGATFRQREGVADASCTRIAGDGGLLLNIQPGDEVIMPTLRLSPPSCFFVLRGAGVFVDIRRIREY